MYIKARNRKVRRISFSIWIAKPDLRRERDEKQVSR